MAADLATEQPVDSAQLSLLLDDIEGFIRRYVVMGRAQSAVIAVWVLHTHALATADMTPYLAVVSAEKRSGKTRLLEVLSHLVRKPLRAGSATQAAIFRSIDVDDPPTLMVDELDTVFGPKAREHEDLRALLNSGYERGTPVLRCVGDGPRIRVESFEVFCPKVLAGIGALPDTIADRSLVIQLKRRTRDEAHDRFRRRDAQPLAHALRERIEKVVESIDTRLSGARPALPEELDDRGQDVVEPLLAIADLAGAAWAARVRRAIIELRGRGNTVADESEGIMLLTDCRRAFDGGDADRLSTEQLIRLLSRDRESPWSGYNGSTRVTPAQLATLLRPYGIRSRSVRIGERTPKGYLRAQFEEAWARYVPSPASVPDSATTPQPALGLALEPTQGRNAVPAVADAFRDVRVDDDWDVAAVADQDAPTTDQDEVDAELEEEIERLYRKHPDIAKGLV